MPATDRLALGAESLEASLADAVSEVRAVGGGSCRLWIGHVLPGDDELAARWGFRPYRDLWQLRRPLPAPPGRLAVRPFEPSDAAAVVELNRRAFAWHPEQGAMDSDDLARRQAEPWYDQTGFLLHERQGQLAGFCWTKTHAGDGPAPNDVAMGEIYVIAVDPDYQGRGIGAPLTLAGLEHLADSGLSVAMLHVESTNRSANAVYDRLGFGLHHINRAYVAEL